MTPKRGYSVVSGGGCPECGGLLMLCYPYDECLDCNYYFEHDEEDFDEL